MLLPFRSNSLRKSDSSYRPYHFGRNSDTTTSHLPQLLSRFLLTLKVFALTILLVDLGFAYRWEGAGRRGTNEAVSRTSAFAITLSLTNCLAVVYYFSLVAK